MDGVIAYILSKKYTDNTVIGMGAIKGAPCQVQSINKIGKTTTITLKWEDNLGNTHTQPFEVEDGVDVSNAVVTNNGHLEITLSDGTVIDCGRILPQYDTMPTADNDHLGAIYQYIGATNASYTNGYFYQCVYEGGAYKWVKKLVQDSYTKIEIGDLTNLPDNTKDVVQNIGNLKLAIDQLSASKLSKTDIDNTLSTTSENPVQNKTITLALNQLHGSLLNKINDKENRFRYSLLPIADSTNVGKIIQYIGSNTGSLTSGYYYQCVEVSTGVYDWVQKNVQPSGGSGSGDGVVDGYYNTTDHLFYEEIAYTNPISGDSDTLYVSLDTNLVYRYNGSIFVRVDECVCESDIINGYYNTTNHKFYKESTYTTEIIGQIEKIYISVDTNIQYRWDGTQFVTISSTIDVDNSFSTTSENPVQNKVITAKINNIDALMATKLSLSDVDGALDGSSLNPVQNRVITNRVDNMTLKINQLNDLMATKLSKSDVDNALSDTSENPVQNKVIKVELDKLSASMLSASLKDKLIKLEPIYLIGSGLNLDPTTGELTASGIDVPIDDHLSTTSVNPVQNKVISLAIDQLQGSVLQKIQKRLSAQADNFAIWDNNGEVDDSGITKDIIPANASASNKVLVKSDVDNALSTTSENPVQNKEITVPLQALQGSMANVKLDITNLQGSILGLKNDKADKVSGATNDNFTTLDANGNLKDSGINKNIVPNTATSSNKLATANDLPDELNDLDDVVITSPTNAQILAYNSTSGKWENKTGQETIGGIVFQGSINFANLPTTGMSNGDAYDIKDAFTTDSRFIEGTGIACDAGTDVVWVASENKWNILTPSGVYSFNGRTGAVSPATSDYDADQIDYDNTTSGLTATDVQNAIDEVNSDLSSHTSNTSNPHSVTKAQVGLGDVINTGDSATPVNGGTTKFTTGGAYTELNKKADKVTSATNGHLAGLDSNGNLTDSGVTASKVIEKVATATGLLKDDGTVDTTSYASSTNAYLVGDTAETTIDDADYFPFYDTSATGKKKTLWSNIKSKLKSYFDGSYIAKVSSATANNIATLNASGEVVDSGKKVSDFETAWNRYQISNLSSSSGDINKVVAEITTNDSKKGHTFIELKVDSRMGNITVGSHKIFIWAGFSSSGLRTIGYTSESAYFRLTRSTTDNYKWYLEYYQKQGTNRIINADFRWRVLESDNITVTNSNFANQTDTVTVIGNSYDYVLNPSSYTMSPTPSSSLTESTVVSTVNGATNTNNNVASLYGIQKYSNEKKVRRILDGSSIPSGTSATSTGIGTWTDSATPTTADEADWWYDAAFMIPDNSNDVDLSIKFDPTGDTVTLGGYILDTTTGKICIKFGNSINISTAKIAVDITYTRNEYSVAGS